MAKRAREQAVKEKRERKLAKKEEAAAERAALTQPPEPGTDETSSEPDADETPADPEEPPA